MNDQHAKAQRLLELHQREHTFVIPNPWDPGSARLLELFGFEALATTSAGFAFSQGRPDNRVARDEVLRHLELMSASTSLPISADFENCFAEDAKGIFENIVLASQTGIVGCSIEDSRNDGSEELYAEEVAVERVQAAVSAARSLPFPFVLTARCEEMLRPSRDLALTITRLQRYQEAGADVLYAPGLRSLPEIETVMRAVDKPVNVLVGSYNPEITVEALAKLGVRRISVGGALARVAWGAVLEAVKEIKGEGTFACFGKAASGKAMNEMFGKGG